MKKNLMQKILKPLTPLIFAGSLLCAPVQSSFAENKKVSFGMGSFSPGQEIIREFYDSISSTTLSIETTLNKINQHLNGARLALGLDATYALKRTNHVIQGNEEIDVENTWNMLTIQPKIMVYLNEKDKVSSYLGLSLPWISATEELEATVYNGVDKNVNLKNRVANMGIGGIIGVNFPLDKKISLYVQASYSKLNVKLKKLEIDGECRDVSKSIGTVNIGGTTLEGGLSLNF